MRLGAAPTDVQLSADDSLCVITGADGCAAYDFGSGRPLSRYTGHASGVAAAAVSADGSCVLTAGADATLRLWSAATGKLIFLQAVSEPADPAADIYLPLWHSIASACALMQ